MYTHLAVPTPYLTKGVSGMAPKFGLGSHRHAVDHTWRQIQS